MKVTFPQKPQMYFLQAQMLPESVRSQKADRSGYGLIIGSIRRHYADGTAVVGAETGAMANYDDILEQVVKKIKDVSAERIRLERDYMRASDVEEEGELYRSEYIEQEHRFGLIVTELRALLFGDVDEIREQYEPKLKARAEYGARQLLHPKKRGTFTLAQVLPDGPVQSYDDYKARLNAAEAREVKIRSQD